MSLRAKTKRRLLLIGIIFFVLIGLGVALYANSVRMKRQQLDTLRADGLTAFYAGDYRKSLGVLSRYIAKNRLDAEALFAYGKSRARVEEANFKHVREGIYVIGEYLKLNPPDTDQARIIEAEHLLLELYTSAGFGPEGVKLADQVLAKSPTDVEALKAKAVSLTRLRKFEEALAVAIALTEVAPLDLQGQALVLELMVEQKTAPADILARSAALRQAHPNDPRFFLLEGFAQLKLDHLPEAKKWLADAARADAPDAEFVRTLANLLDHPGLRMYAESRTLLVKAAESSNDPGIMRLLVQRLWQNGDFLAVLTRLKDVQAGDENANSQLISMKALCLYQLDRSGEADPMVDALAARSEDASAQAWATALTARFRAGGKEPKQAIEDYRTALGRDPSNSIIRYLMGEAYSRLGENELAVDVWRQVAERVPSWSMPVVMISQSLLAKGRLTEAVGAANAAYNRSPNPVAAGNYVVVNYYYALDSGDPSHMKKVLDMAELVQRQHPREPQTLPIYVTLLAQHDRVFTAKAEIKQAIDADMPPSQQTLLQLLSVSRSEDLQMDELILASIEKLYGRSPQLASAQAYELYRAGKPAEALAQLQADVDRHGPDQVVWLLPLAKLKEEMQAPDAAQTWRNLGTRFAGDISVQSAILGSSTAWKDRDLIAQTIDRVQALTGAEGISWRLARARLLLAGDGKERDTAEAISVLKELVRVAPTEANAPLLLAQAYIARKNFSEAITQLTTAAELNPRSLEISSKLFDLFVQQGRMDEARQQLDRVAKLPSLSGEQRLRVARSFAALGQVDAAISMLSQIPEGTKDIQKQAMLAELYRRQNKPEEAKKLYESLIARDEVDPALLIAAAEFFALRGDAALSGQALARLSEKKLAPGERELLEAGLLERQGQAAQAIVKLQSAIQAAPANVVAHLHLSGLLIRERQFDAAKQAINAGLQAAPANADLQALAIQLDLIAANPNAPALATLIEVLSRSPSDEGAAQAIRMIDEVRQKNGTAQDLVNAMQPLASDTFARSLAVQTVYMQALLKAGRVDGAADIALRMMDAYPSAADPARQAVAVFNFAGRWTEMLSAARKWRERSPESPLAPDLAIAEALKRTGDALNALKTLEPYLSTAQQNPDTSAPVLTSYAEALIRTNRQADAEKLLTAYLDRSVAWRQAWIRVGTSSISTSDALNDWIRKVIPFMKADAPDEQEALGGAWHDAGRRFANAKAYAEARRILEPLAMMPNARAPIILAAASAAQESGDIPAALQLYRRALEADPRHADALNNLAFLLIDHGDATEALRLAEQAVAIQPATSGFLDTLARVYVKLGKNDEATKAFERALEIDANNVEALIGLADTLARAGNRDRAKSELDKINILLGGNPPSDPALQKQLTGLRDLLASASE